MAQSSASRRIAILREEVSRKIAAGEVIDRPLSIVRELLDNSLDAGARAIDVSLEAGGLARVRVVDDGAGMDREDLALCWQPHATSKIEREEDLLAIASLGFRGEALSSMAVASRLEVVAKPRSGTESEPAHRLVVRGGRPEILEPCQGRPGTIVEVTELFYNYPARRRFLRSPQAEAGLCKGIFLDRAAAFPDVAFRLFMDGGLRLSLPVANLAERIALCHRLDPKVLGEAEVRRPDFTVRLVGAVPEERRRDRRLLHVFVNRRRVQEFSLLQALEHGFQGTIPGGWHPVAFVFLQIAPNLVDCNIHPTKKEVRLRNLPEVHHAVVQAVQSLLASRGWGRTAIAGRLAEPQRDLSFAPRSSATRELPVESGPGPISRPPVTEAEPGERLRFLGQLYGIFLVLELPDRLLLLDQHAAHERILYDELANRSPQIQDLLFPLSFDVSPEEEARLESRLPKLAEAGIAARRAGAGSWEISGLDARLQSIGEEDLVEMVLRACGEEREWRRGVLATAACRLAIKEGDPVDPVTATELARKALMLAEPRCPHGRPIWHQIERERLFRLVDRPI